MIMSHFWNLCAIISALCAICFGKGAETGAALIQGAVNAITVSISLAGPLSLWAGIGNLMEHIEMNKRLYTPLKPILSKLYPSTRTDPELAGALSANVCSNLLGLGNAATPMGIRAVKIMQRNANTNEATDEMCRLIVMNTASIQLIPTSVAALRAAAGCKTPFDILPCVWISSILSISVGLGAAEFLRRIWKYA